MKETAIEILFKLWYKNRGVLTPKDFDQAKEFEKQHIIKHSIELAKLLFSNPIEKSGKSPQELVDSYFKNK